MPLQFFIDPHPLDATTNCLPSNWNTPKTWPSFDLGDSPGLDLDCSGVSERRPGWWRSLSGGFCRWRSLHCQLCWPGSPPRTWTWTWTGTWSWTWQGRRGRIIEREKMGGTEHTPWVHWPGRSYPQVRSAHYLIRSPSFSSFKFSLRELEESMARSRRTPGSPALSSRCQR